MYFDDIARPLTMSNYSQFLDDLDSFYKNRRLNGIAVEISSEAALAAVRDKWIEQGKLPELVSFVHTNWDSGNCDDFIRPLERILIETNQANLFKLLWTKIIQYRVSALWSSLRDLKASGEGVDLEEIQSIDTSDFNMSSRDAYHNLKKVLAFRRQFAIDALSKMKKGLVQLNQATGDVAQMIDDVSVLKRPKAKF